jgi:hypothetical protein
MNTSNEVEMELKTTLIDMIYFKQPIDEETVKKIIIKINDKKLNEIS